MAWYQRLFNITRSDHLSREIDREMEFHLAERVDELRVRGMSEADARQLARSQFGNPTAQRERTRDADLAEWIQSVAGDIRYALRALGRSPAFTIVAIASLGLGVGANTTIFTLIDALVLRPLPVPHADELVQVSPDTSAQGGNFTNPLWEQVRDRQDVFTAVTAFGETSFNLADGGEARRISGWFVSGDYFATFEVRPAAGRLFARADDPRACPGVAVLSHRFWQRDYGASRDVVGKNINLTGHPFQIIGVTQESFRGPDVGREPDVYAPLCSEAIIAGARSALDRRSTWFLRVIGRLKPDLTVRQAGARLAVIAPAAFAETLPTNYGADSQKDYLARSFHAFPATRGLSYMRTRYSSALFALMAGVALVLLIACANVANLLLSRAQARQRELAIRLAIGAARLRLVRQLMTESLILAFAGAVAGLLLAHWGTQAMVGMLAMDGSASKVSLDLALNGRVLAFTTTLATITVMSFGLFPAWRATRVSAQSAMKAQTRGVVEGQTRWTMGKALVVGQVALSLVLVIAAGLFVGTFRNLSNVRPGFAPNGVLLANVDLRRTRLKPDGFAMAYRSILERSRSIPGIVNAGRADVTPVSGSSWNDVIVIPGYQPKSKDDAVTWFNEVSQGYFSTMETRLLAGRDFDLSDQPGSAPVAIVNDAWARKFFGNGNPLGREFRVSVGDSVGPSITIVGVVENAKYNSLRDDVEPTAYLASSQNATPGPTTTLVLRAKGDPSTLIPPVTHLMSELQSGVTLDFVTLSRQLADSLQRERLLAVLSGLFGVLALSLAMLGLYGVMSYAVARRRAELGVRIALGAGRARVVRMVLGEVVFVVALGLVIGGAVSLGSTTLVATFLYSIQSTEPSVYLLAATLLSVVALGAGLVPAWRAARVDPIEALREQ
jgi:predicted permease